MENSLIGIVVILTPIILTVNAYKLYNARKYTFALSSILLVGLLLRMYIATDLYIHKWDERYHALVAKNLIQHPLKPTLYENPVLPYNYKGWTNNHIWLHKQPIALWCMALSMKVFGVNEIALRLPSILFSVLGIWLTFQIALLLFGRKVAFIAVFLHAIHGLLIELTGGRVPTDHIDIAFQFFIELAIYFGLLAAKKDNKLYVAAMGITTGIAVLTKWLPALIVLPVWMLWKVRYQELQYKKIGMELAMVMGLIIAVALPWQLYIHHTFPLEAKWEQLYNTRHLFEQLEDLNRPFLYHFTTIRIVFGELIYLPLIWLLVMIFHKIKVRRLHLWALGAWIFIPLLFFTFAATKMQAYTLISAPAFFILIALFFRYLCQILPKIKQHKFVFLVKVIAVLMIALPIRYSLERLKPFHQLNRHPQWAQELNAFGETLNPNESNLLFQTEYPIEAMFYCNHLTAYPHLPNEYQLDSLLEKGYEIYIQQKEIVKYK